MRHKQVLVLMRYELDREWKKYLSEFQALEDQPGEWRVCFLDFAVEAEHRKGEPCSWRVAAKILAAEVYEYVDRESAAVMVDGFKLRITTPKGQTVWMWIEKME